MTEPATRMKSGRAETWIKLSSVQFRDMQIFINICLCNNLSTVGGE